MAALKMAAAATRPLLSLGASGEGGHRGQTTVTPRSPGVQCGAGGGEEGVGVGGGPGKSQREGQGEEQKVPLWSGAGRRGSALPNAQKPCW